MIISRPDLFGFHPRKPGSLVTPGEHALGNTASKYVSASNKPNGAPNFEGTSWYIDMAKAEKFGARIIRTEEIAKDLDRLRQLHPNFSARIDKLKSVIDSVEGEVLIEGSVPKGAVQTAEQAARELSLLTGMAKGARVLGGIGVVLTVYDLSGRCAELPTTLC